MSRFVLAGVVAALALLGAACSAPEPVTTGPVATGPVPTSAPASPSAALTAAAAPAPAPGQPSGGVPRCVTADLAGSVGQGDAGAGSMFVPLILTNRSARTCELVGYPGVSYVTGDDGHQVGPAAEMDGPRGAQVNLAPGTAAAAQVRMVNVANFDAAACGPVATRGLRVYPPGDTASLFVPLTSTGCTKTPPGPQLFVQTVKPA